jgi:hypothetical protein
LLIAAAIDADLRQRLLESPDDTFQDYDLSEEEKDLLRRPDHRMLRLFGAALAEQAESGQSSSPQEMAAAQQPHIARQPQWIVQARTLPAMSLALTLVPCAQYENGQLKQIAYAVWVNPLAEGADPAALPPPQGATLPGEPLTPLHAVIQISAVQLQDHGGKPQIGLSASLRQATNLVAPPPPESAGIPDAAPFGSDLRSVQVIAAAAGVRDASSEDRYDRLIDLIHALKGEQVL